MPFTEEELKAKQAFREALATSCDQGFQAGEQRLTARVNPYHPQTPLYIVWEKCWKYVTETQDLKNLGDSLLPVVVAPPLETRTAAPIPSSTADEKIEATMVEVDHLALRVKTLEEQMVGLWAAAPAAVELDKKPAKRRKRDV